MPTHKNIVDWFTNIKSNSKPYDNITKWLLLYTIWTGVCASKHAFNLVYYDVCWFEKRFKQKYIQKLKRTNDKWNEEAIWLSRL